MVHATTSLWLSWNFEPISTLSLVALAAMYFYALGPLRRRFGLANTVSRRQVASFAAGWVMLAVALISPLDALGMDYLLTAHMIQHVIFSVVAPPLLLLGTPGWMLSPLFRNSRTRQIGRVLTHPFTAFGLYNLNMWVWHLPPLLDAVPPAGVVQATALADNALLAVVFVVVGLVAVPRLLRSKPRAVASVASLMVVLAVLALMVLGPFNTATWPASSQAHNPIHSLMNALFIATAILYWCPILSPVPELPRISPLFGTFYMFISTQPMMALGAIIVFSAHPLYSIYAQSAPLLGVTALGDQQLAGLIMWLVMDIPLIVTISILFFKWVNDQDRAERAAAGELDDIFDPATPILSSAVTGTPTGNMGSVGTSGDPPRI